MAGPASGPEGLGDGMGGMSGSGVPGDPGLGGFGGFDLSGKTIGKTIGAILGSALLGTPGTVLGGFLGGEFGKGFEGFGFDGFDLGGFDSGGFGDVDIGGGREGDWNISLPTGGGREGDFNIPIALPPPPVSIGSGRESDFNPQSPSVGSGGGVPLINNASGSMSIPKDSSIPIPTGGSMPIPTDGGSIADQIFNLTSKLRGNFVGGLEDFSEGNFDFASSPMFASNKMAIEDQFKNARDSIISNMPRGGALTNELSNLEIGKAKSLTEMISNIQQDMFNKTQQTAFGTVPSSIAAQTSTSNQGSYLDASRQAQEDAQDNANMMQTGIFLSNIFSDK